MQISELKTKIKSLCSLYTLHSALPARLTDALAGGRNPHLNRYFSLAQQKILFVLALFLLGLLTFKFYYFPPAPSEDITKEIVIEVMGEVRKPGVYIFQRSPCLKEAIEKAGGLKEPASIDPELFSIALETGTLLTVAKGSPSNHIPSSLGGEGKPARRTSSLTGGGEGESIKIKMGTMDAHKLLVFNLPLDLNRVSMEDLCLIPGIGESLAREIITYRQKRKGFRSVEELKNVSGIGERKLEIIKPFLTVSP